MASDINRGVCLMIILFMINQISGLALSYNQPKFCSQASWNPDGIIFANTSTVGLRPSAVFVNTNNTVYVTATQFNQIQIFFEGNVVPNRIISGDLINPWSLFVTVHGNIYVDNGNNNRVDMWTSNATNSTPAMSVDNSCFALFVDIANNLYCSLENHHLVVIQRLDDNRKVSMIVAGTGVSGSASDQLHHPRGIFVDTSFNLFVADCDNDRIQLFRYIQTSGITIAGGETLETTISLNRPTGIVLDADHYLFIVDHGNHRIIRSGSDGFRCLVGCSGTSGSSTNQLMYPHSLSFDSYGNIFVADMGNDRIQKFILASHSCDSQTTISTFAMSTTKTLATKTYKWPNSTSSAYDYSHHYYFLSFLFYFNYIIIQ